MDSLPDLLRKLQSRDAVLQIRLALTIFGAGHTGTKEDVCVGTEH